MRSQKPFSVSSLSAAFSRRDDYRAIASADHAPNRPQTPAIGIWRTVTAAIFEPIRRNLAAFDWGLFLCLTMIFSLLFTLVTLWWLMGVTIGGQ